MPENHTIQDSHLSRGLPLKGEKHWVATPLPAGAGNLFGVFNPKTAAWQPGCHTNDRDQAERWAEELNSSSGDAETLLLKEREAERKAQDATVHALRQIHDEASHHLSHFAADTPLGGFAQDVRRLAEEGLNGTGNSGDSPSALVSYTEKRIYRDAILTVADLDYERHIFNRSTQQSSTTGNSLSGEPGGRGQRGNGHRIEVTFTSDDGMPPMLRLLHPAQGCDPGEGDPEKEPCWLADWLENADEPEGMVRGKVVVPVTYELDGDQPRFTLQADTHLSGDGERLEVTDKMVAEVMRARRGWHSGVRVNVDVPEARQIRADLTVAFDLATRLSPENSEPRKCENPRCGESFPGQVTLKYDGAHIWTAPCPDCSPAASPENSSGVEEGADEAGRGAAHCMSCGNHVGSLHDSGCPQSADYPKVLWQDCGPTQPNAPTRLSEGRRNWWFYVHSNGYYASINDGRSGDTLLRIGGKQGAPGSHDLAKVRAFAGHFARLSMEGGEEGLRERVIEAARRWYEAEYRALPTYQVDDEARLLGEALAALDATQKPQDEEER